MLCCIFNYAPLYRTSIFRKIDEGFDVRFHFGREVPGRQGIARLDYGIFRHPPVEFSSVNPFGQFPWYCGIQHLAFSRRYKVFLITGEFNWAYMPFLLFCRISGKKVYAWGHGLKSLGRYAPLKRFFYNSLEGYFIYGQKGLERMAELGFPREKFYVVANSLCGRDELSMPLAHLASDVYARHFGNTDPVLIFTGRLTRVKRLDLMVEALHLLPLSGSRFNAVLVGDGVCRGELEAMVKEKGLADRVWFYGECYDESLLAGLIYNADLCLSPGNSGLTAIHSMRYGTPVATNDDFETQMPEYEAVVPGRTGVLFGKDSPSSIAAAVSDWFSKGYGREAVRRECLGTLSEKWNSDAQMDVFRKVLGPAVEACGK
ncbi:MAG: glycosyltransferase [Candidatus Cryptobacteroides sp.]